MFEAEIAEGVKFLDANHPGWELELDLGKLKMQDCHECVLGQIVCEYNMAIETELVPLDLVGDEIGFDIPEWAGNGAFDMVHHYEPDLDHFNVRSKAFRIITHYYEVLTDEWGAMVKDRLNKGVSV